MSKINDLTEPWNGHTHKEVEDFIKENLNNVKIETVRLYTTSTTGNGLGLIDISQEELIAKLNKGPVYAILYNSRDAFKIIGTGFLDYSPAYLVTDNTYIRLRIASNDTPYVLVISSGGCGCC